MSSFGKSIVSFTGKTGGAIAVVCGKLIARKISERWLTGLSGRLFLLFGAIAIVESL